MLAIKTLPTIAESWKPTKKSYSRICRPAIRSGQLECLLSARDHVGNLIQQPVVWSFRKDIVSAALPGIEPTSPCSQAWRYTASATMLLHIWDHVARSLALYIEKNQRKKDITLFHCMTKQQQLLNMYWPAASQLCTPQLNGDMNCFFFFVWDSHLVSCAWRNVL